MSRDSGAGGQGDQAQAPPPGGPQYAAATDVGLIRSNNEDAYLAAPPLFAVADGMGGHRAGEVASAGAIRVLQAEAGHDSDSLVAAVQAANRAVHAEASANPQLAGMGTTITAMMATHDAAQIVHVGDSRAYRLRDGKLRRLTRDHTVVDRLAREGKIPAEEVDRHPQRSVLERALGVGPEVEVDVQLLDVRPGDRILLCTDGLTSMLDDDEIQAILEREADPALAARALIQAALSAGGKDNVTAVVVDYPAAEQPSADDPTRTAEQPAVILAGGPPYGSGGGPSASRATGGIPPAPVASGRRHGQRQSASPIRDRPPPPRPGAMPGPDSGPVLIGPRPRRVRLLVGLLVGVPILAIALGAGAIALHNSWYVGQRNGRVAVFRGVPGSFAGIRVSSVVTLTDIAVANLPATYQGQVRDGISASNKAEAARTVENLRHLQVPAAVAITPTSTVTSTATETPTGTTTVGPSP